MHTNAQLKPLRDSFACVAAALIAVDGKTTSREVERFHEFFTREFGVDQEQADALLEQGMQQRERVDEHIAVLSAVLPHNLLERGRFMRFFNDCIITDGIDDREYPLFDKIRDQLFT